MKNSIKTKMAGKVIDIRHRIKQNKVTIDGGVGCTIRAGDYAGYRGYVVDTDEGMACLVEDKRQKGKVIDVVLLPKEMDIQIRQGFKEVIADV